MSIIARKPKLSKLEIRALQSNSGPNINDDKYDSSLNLSASSGKSLIFVAPFNPETYGESAKTVWETTAPLGKEKIPRGVINQGLKTYDFEFLLDATGLYEEDLSLKQAIMRSLKSLPDLVYVDGRPNELTYVQKMVMQFKKVTFTFDNDKHSPSKLQVVWGPLNEILFLSDYSVTYKLFNPSGQPIRAVLKAKFVSAEQAYKVPDDKKDKSTDDAQNKDSSPDVTHEVVVKSGDRLSLLCEKIYGSQSYQQQVAEHNGLVNFRKLTPGLKLSFPPLK